MRVAIVHDWLTHLGGAEWVLRELLAIYPEADLYSIVDFLDQEEREVVFGKTATTSFIQHLPGAKAHYRSYLPLMPLAIEQFDLGEYEVVISSSHAVAKGVITGPDQVHVAYVHSPMRYAWDQQSTYLRTASGMNRLKRLAARYFLHKLRIWDVRTSHGPDVYLANSTFIARRIRKCYGRKAQVVYPPVNVERFNPDSRFGDFFLTVSRLVPYKRTDLVIRAFSQMPDKRLVVVGGGPEEETLRRIATSNVEVLGHRPPDEVKHLMETCRAFVYAAKEDFGIVMAEAQAAGRPVIAFAKGGAEDIVVPGITGILYSHQTTDDLLTAVSEFEREIETFDPVRIREHSLRFSPEAFRKGIIDAVDRTLRSYMG